MPKPAKPIRQPVWLNPTIANSKTAMPFFPSLMLRPALLRPTKLAAAAVLARLSVDGLNVGAPPASGTRCLDDHWPVRVEPESFFRLNRHLLAHHATGASASD